MRFRLLAAALLSVATMTAAQVKRERGSHFTVTEGQFAPLFSFVTNEGDTLDADLLRGQVLVLQFAASWCPFSTAQMEDYQRFLWSKHKDDAAFSMYIFCEDAPDARHDFETLLREHGIDIPYIFDANEQIYKLFVTPNGSVTRTVIISPDWKIQGLYDKHTRRGLRKIRRSVDKLLRDAER